jgi:hypothetical protein
VESKGVGRPSYTFCGSVLERDQGQLQAKRTLTAVQVIKSNKVMVGFARRQFATQGQSYFSIVKMIDLVKYNISKLAEGYLAILIPVHVIEHILDLAVKNKRIKEL